MLDRDTRVSDGSFEEYRNEEHDAVEIGLSMWWTREKPEHVLEDAGGEYSVELVKRASEIAEVMDRHGKELTTLLHSAVDYLEFVERHNVPFFPERFVQDFSSVTHFMFEQMDEV